MSNDIRSFDTFRARWELCAGLRLEDGEEPPSLICEDAEKLRDANVRIDIPESSESFTSEFQEPYRIRGISLQYTTELWPGEKASGVYIELYETIVEGLPNGFELVENDPEGTQLRLGVIANGEYREATDDIAQRRLPEMLMIAGITILGRLREGYPPFEVLRRTLEHPLLGWYTANCWIQQANIEDAQRVAAEETQGEPEAAKDRLTDALLSELRTFHRSLQNDRLGLALGRKADVPFWDAALADWIEKLGDKQAAPLIRNKRRGAGVRKLWDYWLPEEQGGIPRGVKILARALWEQKIKPELEAEEQKPLARMSSDLGRTLGIGRHYGCRITPPSSNDDEPTISVEPPRGVALWLPYDDSLKVTKDKEVVSLQRVLGPAELRTYIATLFLFQDAGANPEGTFTIQGAREILDLMGVGRRKDPKGRCGQRYGSKETKAIQEHLDLFPKIRVRAVGDLVATGGDPLVDKIVMLSTGKTVTYAHSRLIVGHMQNNYFQLPRAILRLAANNDVLLGMGIAQVIRDRILKHLKDGAPIEAPIQHWLEAAGIDPADGVRKHGRIYWAKTTDDLVRVADEGDLGQMTIEGTGKETVLRLTPHSKLQGGYAPILEASKRHAKARNRALVEKKKSGMRG